MTFLDCTINVVITARNGTVSNVPQTRALGVYNVVSLVIEMLSVQ